MNKQHHKTSVAGSKPIFKDMKCHHWNGNMLVKEKECRHVLPRGYMAQTLVLGYEPDWTKGLKKHNGTTGFMGASLKGWKKGTNKKILFRINIFRYSIELTKKI